MRTSSVPRYSLEYIFIFGKSVPFLDYIHYSYGCYPTALFRFYGFPYCERYSRGNLSSEQWIATILSLFLVELVALNFPLSIMRVKWFVSHNFGSFSKYILKLWHYEKLGNVIGSCVYNPLFYVGRSFHYVWRFENRF